MEGNTILAALAARTSKINLGLLVGGVTYRNPALVAKLTTTIDIISGGRAVLGIGAAWFEEEHKAYGFDFPPLKERFERLEDALNITRMMFTETRRDLRGQAPPRRRRVQQPEADPRGHPDPDRRQRRAQDAAVRRPVRRRLEPVRRRRARQAPARRARRPLRGRSAATRARSPRPAWATRVHRADPRGGRGEVRRRCWRRGRPGARAGAGLHRRARPRSPSRCRPTSTPAWTASRSRCRTSTTSSRSRSPARRSSAVIGTQDHVVPRPEDVQRIAAIRNPVLRNLEITHAYSLLAADVAARSGQGANWCVVRDLGVAPGGRDDPRRGHARRS